MHLVLKVVTPSLHWRIIDVSKVRRQTSKELELAVEIRKHGSRHVDSNFRTRVSHLRWLPCSLLDSLIRKDIL